VSRRRQLRLARTGIGAVVLLGLLLTQCSGRSARHAAPPGPTTTASSAPPPTSVPFPSSATGPAHLQPGSDPAVLPGPVLIADRGNNRLIIIDPQGRLLWEFPRPGDLAPGESFKVPDDAFFTPDGKQIIATEEDDFVISLVDIASHRIVWRYGVPGHSGSGPNHVNNPDDALVLPNGDVLSADIKNCRIIVIPPGSHDVLRVFGGGPGTCSHDPTQRFGSPNGAFPMTNGHYLVTEINGDWVDEINLAGHLYASFHPPGMSYPSDSNEVSPGVYLSVDYSKPGMIETFDGTGKVLWQYRPTGPAALDQPSLAVPLPNGDFLCNDDYNHRVIVVDPRSNRVVWQYGFTGQPGTAPGYLRIPDGLDLVPPHSLLITHAPTMGLAR
jgi:hypothetical protein